MVDLATFGGDVERRRADVLVIGAGAAGLRAAIALDEMGARALVVSKRPRADAHTVLAAGGINAALGTMDPEDNWRVHAADTLVEGRMLGDPRAVEILCREAPRAIAELVGYGANFARGTDGRLLQRYQRRDYPETDGAWKRTIVTSMVPKGLELTTEELPEASPEVAAAIGESRELALEGRLLE